MASADVIQKLVSEDLQKASNQFSTMFKDRLDALKQTIQSIALLIADDKPENRPRYLTVLVDVLIRNQSKLPSGEMIDLFKNALPEVGHRVAKRARRMALTFCYLAIAKAGYTHKNDNLLRQILTEIFNIYTSNIWMQASCAAMLTDIISMNISDDDQFLDSYISLFDSIKEEIPSSVDNFFFWLKLKKLFPKIELSDFYKDPMTTDSFIRFTSLLKTTFVALPIIHPIWHLLAEYDANKLLEIVDELWAQKGENRWLVSVACASAVPFLVAPELVKFISNSNLFEFALSCKKNTNLITSLNKRLLPMIEEADESSFQLIHALLLIPREHSFVSETINKGCASFNDEQTTRMIKSLNDLPFKPLCALLWTQRHRSNISNDSIITDLFNMAANCAFNVSDIEELSNFIARNMNRVMPNGKSWFKLISGIDLPTTESSSSIENLIESTNKAIDGINNISTILKIKPIFEKCAVSIESFVDLIGQLNKSKYEHWHQISKILVQKAIPLLRPEHANLITTKSTLLPIAVQDPRLCESVLPSYVEHIDKIHPFSDETDQKDINEKLSFPISPEGIEKVLPAVLVRCSGKPNLHQEKVALWLVNHISDESANQIVKSQIDLILNDEKGKVGGEAFISMLVRSSSTMAYEVLTYLTTVGGSYDKQSAIHKIETWIDDCCSSSDIPVDDIARAIYTVLDHDFPSTSSGKKKAESALVWAQKLINKVQRQIPRDIFEPLTEKFKNTGSRNAQKIIRQISGTSIE